MSATCTRCGVPVSEPGRRCRDCGRAGTTGIGWHADAACADESPELWFPSGRDDERTQREALARGICSTCPVAAPCAQYAIDHHLHHGIWGGLDVAQRETLRRHQQRQATRKAARP